ncbi:hypothetical protein CDD82_7130 [Ophiocordyceps australis]|uniref:SNF7 family protein n=1 Tax=Ophiocordyceps australis TaxID=1399860 RepID=A0A2C5Y6R5_9HYPO|nr:hypothetical protein CDD82_7130 [Ophiocordyceps australis]
MGELADYLVQHDANFRRSRLPALYSDFRSLETLNPDGFKANVAAWRDALFMLASKGLLSRHGSGYFILQVDDSLPRLLENKQYGQPLALGTALGEALTDRHLVSLDSFLHSPPQAASSHSGWSAMPWNALSWTLRQLGISDPLRGEDKIPKGRFVMMDNVQAAAEDLERQVLAADDASRFSRVFTKSQLLTRLVEDKKQLSETELQVLLTLLSRDNKSVAYDGNTIKFVRVGEENTLTEEDTAIASIKELTAHLRHQVSLLNTRIDQLSQEARDAISHKNRVSALAALKSKKLAESSLAQRYASLSQLEEVASKIQQASDQVQLVKVMESSAGVLEHLNSRIGSVDRVEGVMDRLREQVSDTDEIAAILAESSTATIDESEINDELETLLEQEDGKRLEQKQKTEQLEAEAEAAKARIRLDELPPVPEGIQLKHGRESITATPTTETGIARLTLNNEEAAAAGHAQ